MKLSIIALALASTVAMAFAVDRERVTRWQSVGLGLAAAALVLASLLGGILVTARESRIARAALRQAKEALSTADDRWLQAEAAKDEARQRSGIANVKWLSEINVQEDQYLGKFQARWYRTLRGEMINGEMKWVEKAVSHMQLKSFVARVTKNGADHKITAIALNDGTPFKTVELKIDDGQWVTMQADAQTSAKYGWKLYTYTWKNAPAGEHTLVSRATDVNGQVQPTEKDIETKKTFLEDNSQHPRKVMIA